LIGSGVTYSVLIEFQDHFTVIEAALEPLLLAVIAKARELRPGKPVTEVIKTHYHFDHIGGIRAAVSEGLTVIGHQLTAPFFEELVGRRFTIAPDALARNPRRLRFRGVPDELTLTDGTMTVELFTASGSPHGDGILVAYLPGEKLLIQADLYSPILRATTYTPNLLDLVRRRKLAVERMVPIHGSVVPFEQFVKAAESTRRP
jgi:glyoxylase-like metal-dependent hydrolase (beta-lactamase superfamily II)